MPSKMSKVNRNTQQRCGLLQVPATFGTRDRLRCTALAARFTDALFKKMAIS